MWTYLIRRLLLAVPTLLGITLVTFVFISMAPGDPAELQVQGIMNPRTSARVVEELRRYYGLDQPVPVQYVRWLGRIVGFDLSEWDYKQPFATLSAVHYTHPLDFGNSMTPDRRKVIIKIRERLPATLALSAISLLLGLALAIPVGIYAAAKRDGPFDVITSMILYVLYSVPSYVMAVPLILVVSVQLDWLPFRGMMSDDYENFSFGGKIVDLAKHFALITLCYTYGAVAYDSRFVRQNLLEVLQQDYIRTARAKGLPERQVLLRHGFRNTLIPLLTMFGLMLPVLIGGSVILEVMFSWPGIGRLFYNSIMARDITTVMALSFITACLVLLGTLLADLLYAWADPRVKYE